MNDKHSLKKHLLTVALSLVTLAALVCPAQGIPAFARKYGMSCTTCHAPVPRLKAFGDDFAGNAFVLENQEAPRYMVKTGDDNLDLLRSFPVAARLDGMIKAHTEADQGVDFSAPYNLKLLSGGSITSRIAYYFYFFMSERGEVAGIEDAYIMFNNLLGRDLDLYVGQFQVSDPLFKRELRLTYEDYMIYKSSYGDTRIDLTYDRGFMVTYGIDRGPDLIFEVLNGNGIGEADEYRTFDDDKYKTFAGRISYDVTENVRAGVFGYYGKEDAMSYELVLNPVTDEYDTTDAAYRTNTVIYYAPDLTLAVDKLELNLQYMERIDDNPAFEFVEPGDDVKIRGGFAECIYWPDGDRSRWYLVGLYNHVELDRGDAYGAETMYQTLTGHAGYVLRTNLRLYVENTYDIENEENRLVIGFVSGF
jgi:hypothetical protein